MSAAAPSRWRRRSSQSCECSGQVSMPQSQEAVTEPAVRTKAGVRRAGARHSSSCSKEARLMWQCRRSSYVLIGAGGSPRCTAVDAALTSPSWLWAGSRRRETECVRKSASVMFYVSSLCTRSLCTRSGGGDLCSGRGSMRGSIGSRGCGGGMGRVCAGTLQSDPELLP